MKKISEKIIPSVIVLSLVIGLCLNVLIIFRPKTAKATDAGGAIMNFIKEMGLDSIASSVAEMMLTKLEQNIFDWGMGRKSDINLPFSINDMNDYLDEALNMATGRLIEKYRKTDLCEPIQKSFGERFKATFTIQYQNRPEYETYAGCSLNTVINNVKAFIKRPRITLFGWDAWKALKTPNNNLFGSFFLAQDIKIKTLRDAKENAKQKAVQNQGYRDETKTAETNKELGRQTCAEKYPNTGPVEIDSGDMTECYSFCGADISNCLAEYPLETAYCNNRRVQCLRSTPACAPSASPDGPSQYELYQQCLQDVDKQPETPTKLTISNAGAHIAELMKDALKLKSDKLGVVDEITELVGVFFQALINKATTTGLQTLSAATKQASLAQKSRVTNKDTYGYLRAYSKINTRANKKNVRATLVAGMDKAIKQLTRSIINCGEKEVMHLEEFAKNLNGVLESNMEALYVGVQGINLKSDAVVLDPPYAPYSVYGYSWGEIFPTKVPDKCRGILNQMNLSTNTNCTDIISGLEPNYGLTPIITTLPQCNDNTDNDNDGYIDYPTDSDCSSPTDTTETTAGGGGGGGGGETERERIPQMLDIIPGFGESSCLPCMYDHDALNCPQGPTPPQPYPGTSFMGVGSPSTVWTTAILQQKQAHYDGCHEWYDIALDRCDECTRAYDSKCSRLRTEEQKNQCLARYCNNYTEISDHVIDPPNGPFDFYNKCLIEEQKSACFACLMENFIPATYCEQTKDYVARMIIKYPAVVKLVRTGDNKGQFLGLFDQTISDMGGECNDNWDKKNISLALICRVLPEFSLNGIKRCRTDCFRAGMTNAQLLDITDFRPDENDCGNIKLDVGGKEPFFAMDDGILESRGICCADFWQKSRKQYATCVGAGPTTGEPDSTTTSNFACTLSANPVSGLAPLNNVDLTINATGLNSGNAMTYQFDCNNDGTIERTINNTASGPIFNTTIADVCSYSASNATYTASATVINEFGNSISCRTSVQTTDCEITSTLNPTSGIIPVTTNIVARLNNVTVPGNFTFRFYCNVPGDGGPVSSWSGESIEYVTTNNEQNFDGCIFDTAGTKGIGVSILNNASGSTSSCYQTITVSGGPEIACDAEVLSGMVYVGDPVDVVVNAMPNSSYTNLIHNAVGTVITYACNGYNSTQTISNATALGTHERTLYCNFNASGDYPITVTIGNTNSANGFSATDTCGASIIVESSGDGGGGGGGGGGILQ
jgi:hypothetical protein